MQLSFFIFLTLSIALGIYIGTHPKSFIQLLSELISSLIGLAILIVILGIIIGGIFFIRDLPPSIYEFSGYLMLLIFTLVGIGKSLKYIKENGLKKSIKSALLYIPNLRGKQINETKNPVGKLFIRSYYFLFYLCLLFIVVMLFISLLISALHLI